MIVGEKEALKEKTNGKYKRRPPVGGRRGGVVAYQLPRDFVATQLKTVD
jgi:hypothetical protein